MAEVITATLPLTRWQGDRGTYHLVSFVAEQAEALTMTARLHRLEFGRARGFGSVKVTARIGETEWSSSVFPQKGDDGAQDSKHWILLVSKKVMQREGLCAGDPVEVSVTPL